MKETRDGNHHWDLRERIADRHGTGNDLLVGGRGNDRIDGGPGLDTASFAGAFAAFSVEQSGAGFVVTEAVTADTDFVTDVEFFQFTDVVLETWLIA